MPLRLSSNSLFRVTAVPETACRHGVPVKTRLAIVAGKNQDNAHHGRI
jgi:hypothetical protein